LARVELAIFIEYRPCEALVLSVDMVVVGVLEVLFTNQPLVPRLSKSPFAIRLVAVGAVVTFKMLVLLASWISNPPPPAVASWPEVSAVGGAVVETTGVPVPISLNDVDWIPDEVSTVPIKPVV